jgi:hypothetical protein
MSESPDSSGESGDQALLVEPEQTRKPQPDTVWVVRSRKEDCPHAFVEAVYDNEEAAMEHKRELGENSFQHGVVAWGVDKRTILGEYDGE